MIDFFVVARIQRHLDHIAAGPSGVDDQAVFAAVLEDVRAHGQQIAGGLDRKKTRSGNPHGRGVVEKGNGRPHGALDLKHRRAAAISGIQGFGIEDHRQIQDSAPAEQLLDAVQPDPDVVGVEVTVAADVLEGVDLFIGALGGFPQNQTAVVKTGQVTALHIGRRFFGNLHHEGKIPVGEISQKRRLDAGAEVVAVGDKGVAQPVAQHFLQQA